VIPSNLWGSLPKNAYLVSEAMGTTMVALFLIASIAGILLALRFKVFILIPATSLQRQ
jgi:hypothetical protein